MALAIPAYTYTGKSTSSSDNNYWYITLTTSGTLKFTKATHTVDVFLVGGGGSGHQGTNHGLSGGGGGGYTKTVKGITAAVNTNYVAAIGAGGSVSSSKNLQTNTGSNGGATTMFSNTANGGARGGYKDYVGSSGIMGVPGIGGNGGSAGATSGYYTWDSSAQMANAGTNGGSAGSAKGQGTTTRPFGESTGTAYSGGGGGGGHDKFKGGNPGAYGGGTGGFHKDWSSSSTWVKSTAGTANSGGGGGGGHNIGTESTNLGDANYIAKAGGSGLIMIRGKTKDGLPVKYNGTDLTEIRFVNGTAAAVTVTSLTYNGTKLY